MSGIIALKQNVDFHRIYSRGKSKADSVLVTYALKTRGNEQHIGITTSKKLGNAVERNRCRRVIRAAYSSMQSECSGGWNIVFVARFKTKQTKSTDLSVVMKKQLKDLGVIKTD